MSEDTERHLDQEAESEAREIAIDAATEYAMTDMSLMDFERALTLNVVLSDCDENPGVDSPAYNLRNLHQAFMDAMIEKQKLRIWLTLLEEKLLNWIYFNHREEVDSNTE